MLDGQLELITYIEVILFGIQSISLTINANLA